MYRDIILHRMLWSTIVQALPGIAEQKHLDAAHMQQPHWGEVWFVVLRNFLQTSTSDQALYLATFDRTDKLLLCKCCRRKESA